MSYTNKLILLATKKTQTSTKASNEGFYYHIAITYNILLIQQNISLDHKIFRLASYRYL